MATFSIENGKRIDSLLEADTVTDNSLFLLSEKNLTRSITLYRLRKLFSADAADSNLDNLYYSAQRINTLIESINNSLAAMSTTITNTTNKVESIYTDFGGSVSELENKYNQMYKDLTEADTNLKTELNQRIDNVYNTLNDSLTKTAQDIRNELAQAKTELSNKINTEVTNLTKSIADTKTELEGKISAVDKKADTIASDLAALTKTVNDLSTTVTNFMNLFTISDQVPPANLSNGKIYLQFFND